MPVDPLPPSGAVWWPNHCTVQDANLTRFMQTLGVDGFEALNERANADPAGFHDALSRFLDFRFQRPYDQVLDLSEGLPFAHWCVGGTTNVALNYMDRWRGTERYNEPALVWEGKDGAVSTWTFADLDRENCRLSWGLRRLGLGRSAFKPSRVVFVEDLPRTRTMKVMRLIVRSTWLGDGPGDLSTLLNPASVSSIRAAHAAHAAHATHATHATHAAHAAQPAHSAV